MAVGLATNRLPGVRVSLPPEWRGLETDPMIDSIGARIFGRAPGDPTRKAIEEQLDAFEERLAAIGLPAWLGRSDDGRIRLTLGWMLASAEFQRR